MKCLQNPCPMHASVGEIWDCLRIFDDVYLFHKSCASLCLFHVVESGKPFWVFLAPKPFTSLQPGYLTPGYLVAKGRRPNWSPCHGERTDRAFVWRIGDGHGVEEFKKRRPTPEPVVCALMLPARKLADTNDSSSTHKAHCEQRLLQHFWLGIYNHPDMN